MGKRRGGANKEEVRRHREREREVDPVVIDKATSKTVIELLIEAPPFDDDVMAVQPMTEKSKVIKWDMKPDLKERLSRKASDDG